MVAIVGENDVQRALVVQIEAAESGARSVEDLQPPLFNKLHADRKQGFLVALPFTGWK